MECVMLDSLIKSVNSRDFVFSFSISIQFDKRANYFESGVLKDEKGVLMR